MASSRGLLSDTVSDRLNCSYSDMLLGVAGAHARPCPDIHALSRGATRARAGRLQNAATVIRN
eukprot:10092444-Alexandrium_andersonii.AAC.1